MGKKKDKCVVCGKPSDYILTSDVYPITSTPCCDEHYDQVWLDLFEAASLWKISLFEDKYHGKNVPV